MTKPICIGLFGTCGSCKWRDAFKEFYTEQNMNFFDPNKADWKPEDAEEEAQHLAEDEIILFPVTSGSYGTGSLAEVGFSILQASRVDDRRDFILLVSEDLDESLSDPVARKESLRARALVRQHLKKLHLKNVYVVDTLAQMMEVSVGLYAAARIRAPHAKYNPQNVEK